MAQLDKSTLEKYIKLDKQIHEQESKNTVKSLSVKEQQLKDLEETVSQLQAHYDGCVKQTEKEKKDVDQLSSVREMFESQSAYDQKMTKEQEEYMDALNKQEIAKKELDGVREQMQDVQKATEKLKNDNEVLLKLYEEHDELLRSIFMGEYGSAEENRLEQELDVLTDKRQRIHVADYKWSQGKQLLGHGVGQLTVAEKKWDEVAKVPATNSKKRYELATEARNNIVAAASNLTSCQKYLSNITFPYCAPKEIDTLNRAVSHIYTDMMSTDRHQHAKNVYVVTRKRAAALSQWFDNVIQNTIKNDFEKAKAECNAVEIALRKERLRLIKEKIAEQNGGAVTNVKGEMDLGKESNKKVEQEYVSKPDANSKPAQPPTPAGVPLSQLAPTPSQDELFGELDSLKKQHENDLKEFEKAQKMNKTRTEQGLQEKLAARRNRRQRIQAQEQQASQLS